MKISSSPLIPIARQDVSRTTRRALPVEIETARTSGSVREDVQVYKPDRDENSSQRVAGGEQNLVKYQEIQKQAIDLYKTTAAIETGKGEGDLIGVDVFA